VLDFLVIDDGFAADTRAKITNYLSLPTRSNSSDRYLVRPWVFR